MPMRFLVVGDLQLLCEDTASDRAEQSRGTLSWILSLMDQYRPDAFVHLGDLGERNDGIDHYTLSLVSWFVREVGNRIAPAHAFWLVGNHDYFTADGSINLMSSLAPWMEPHHVVVWPWKTGPEGTLFVSYLEGPEKFRLETGLLFEAREKSVLFCHQPISGSLWRAGGVESAGIAAEILPRQTFVGHYHMPNPCPAVWAAFGNAVWFCGAPMAHDFRDNAYGLTAEQQLRGVWLVDIQNGDILQRPYQLLNPCCQYFLSFQTDFGPGGEVLDQWLPSCVLPPERTTVKLTVPPGKEDMARVAFRSYKSVSVLSASTSQNLGSGLPPVVNPHATSDATVRQYVSQLPDDKLAGLPRYPLIQAGTSFLPPGN